MLVALALVVAAPLSDADNVKNAPKKNSVAAALLKKLDKAELTDEQVAKLPKKSSRSKKSG